MTFRQLQKTSAPHYYPLILDKFIPKLLRSILRKTFSVAAILSFVFSFDSLPLYFGSADGLFFLFADLYLILFFLETFYRSMMGEGVKVRIDESLVTTDKEIDYALSSIIFEADEIDVARSLFENKIGLQIFARSGIEESECKDFIYGKRVPIMASTLEFGSSPVDLKGYVTALYDADKSLQSFLSAHAVSKEEFIGAANWVMQLEEKKRRENRFWSRENLGSMPSIGKSWSYGEVADLGKYGNLFLDSADISFLDIENGYREREVSLIESILERKKEANVIIIDDDEGVARDIVGRLLKKIKLGTAPPFIEHKMIFELEWNTLVSDYKNRTELEAEFLKILNQSVLAGNVILYIRDFSSLVSSFNTIGINLPSLLSPYLSSSSLQIIASVSNADFHFFIETNASLLQKFERVIPDKVGSQAVLPVLFEQVMNIEKQSGLKFSYPAVLVLVNSAERLATYGEVLGKSLDLLFELAPWAIERNISIIKENDVSIFVTEKTGMASGPIKEKEAKLIENLEETLHQRVIGQDEAVAGIASAVRRSRLGVGNPKKPLSSFLFLGPTGVGKTEVSKALAESFFGDESKMVRFDMSEYSGAGALAALIGDFALNKSGLLANKVRDTAYSVLLLDEFEKASGEVLDLFLQILDEGVFTDALGREVNCRNLIIIATSNAGSDLIWETINAGKDLTAEKNKIISQIIAEKIFKPELLNRFDGVILFRPLLQQQLFDVARLGLAKLKERLKEKDIELVINDELINFLVAKGSDPQFGGRAINRAIQNEVEDLVARKMLSGEAKAGAKIEIKKEELEKMA